MKCPKCKGSGEVWTHYENPFLAKEFTCDLCWGQCVVTRRIGKRWIDEIRLGDR